MCASRTRLYYYPPSRNPGSATVEALFMLKLNIGKLSNGVGLNAAFDISEINMDYVRGGA